MKKCVLSGKEMEHLRGEQWKLFADGSAISNESAAKLPQWMLQNETLLASFCVAWQVGKMTFEQFEKGTWVWREMTNVLYRTPYNVPNVSHESRPLHFFKNGKYEASLHRTCHFSMEQDSTWDSLNVRRYKTLHAEMVVQHARATQKTHTMTLNRLRKRLTE